MDNWRSNLRTPWLPLFATLLIAGFVNAAPQNAYKKREHKGGVEGEFIVVLPDTTPSAAVAGLARALADKYDVKIEAVWPYSLKGFLCIASANASDRLADDSRVEYVEQNLRTRAAPHATASSAPSLQVVSGTQYTFYDWNCRSDHPMVSHQPPNCTPNYRYLWSLDRLDELSWSQRNGLYNMCPEGRSVVAYMIDMGIWRDHPEFETPTRVIKNLDFSSDRTNLNLQYTDDASNGCLILASGTAPLSRALSAERTLVQRNHRSSRSRCTTVRAASTSLRLSARWTGSHRRTTISATSRA